MKLFDLFKPLQKLTPAASCNDRERVRRTAVGGVFTLIKIGSIVGLFALLKVIGISFTNGDGLGTEILLGMGLLLYFLPAVIASERRHKDAVPIVIMNTFFGWTLIGWVGCLAWGLSHHVRIAS